LYKHQEFQNFLDLEGLKELPDFFKLSGELVGVGRFGKEVYKVSIGEDFYYLKIMRKEPLGHYIERFLRGMRPHSTPVIESHTLLAMQEKELPVCRVVAYGERGGFLPNKGFLLTKALDGYMADQYYQVEHQDFVKSYAKLFATLHVKGFYQNLRLKDVVVDENKQLHLIDREAKLPMPFTSHRNRCIHAVFKTFFWEAKYNSGLFKEHLDLFFQHYLSINQLEITPEAFKSEIKAMMAKKKKLELDKVVLGRES
jgi:hypothetical protein